LISVFISVGEFFYLLPATNLEHLSSKDDAFANLQMLNQFQSTTTFEQVTNMYNVKTCDQSSNEKDVFININLYLGRYSLQTSLGCFNSRVPQCRMLVLTDPAIEGCLMEETVDSLMVIHMNSYNRLMEGLLNVYFIDSFYHTMILCFMMKYSAFHVCSASDLFRKTFAGFISHSELQNNHLVKVSDGVCKMMCRVAASQPQKNRVHINMMPSVWLTMKRYLLEEMNGKRLEIYYDNYVTVPTVKRGFFVTPDKKMIQLATVERQMEDHHKFDRMIAYTREHISILQYVFDITFVIGARVRHRKPMSTDDREMRQIANIISKSSL
jgi:hypothetical protein